MNVMTLRHIQAGFTLIEAVLSVALISIIASLSLPFYQSFQTRNDLTSSAQSVAEMLRRAQTYSRANNGDAQWGVNLQAGTVTLFKGTSYASRSSGFDETIAIPTPITLSYSGDIVFSKLNGFPASIATETFSSNGNTKTISVNAKGMVND